MVQGRQHDVQQPVELVEEEFQLRQVCVEELGHVMLLYNVLESFEGFDFIHEEEI